MYWLIKRQYYIIYLGNSGFFSCFPVSKYVTMHKLISNFCMVNLLTMPSKKV